jgi:hypothetical protein
MAVFDPTLVFMQMLGAGVLREGIRFGHAPVPGTWT